MKSADEVGKKREKQKKNAQLGENMSDYTFSQVPRAEIPRSSFNRSHGHKTTIDAGYLVPFFVDEALPGDTFAARASIFARLATPLVPIMDNMMMDVFYFAVPNRLLWSDWQHFCGEQDNPGDSTDFVIPQVNAGLGFAVGSIFDYFGLPTAVPNIDANALYSRAYALIWNEWFRDENLQDRTPFSNGPGPDLPADYPLLKRGKRHDYFTSCLPWPQKGPGVEVPMGGTAEVVGDPTMGGYPYPTWQVQPTAGVVGFTNPQRMGFADTTQGTPEPVTIGSDTALSPLSGPYGVTWATSGLVADLSTATGVTINAMRESFQIQKLLERDARGGTRYTEILRSHFGVVSPDFRLQRPEYLGGGSISININPVAQTSGSGTYTDTPQGNLAGYGTAGGSGLGFVKSFVEHSVIIGMVCVRADLSYQQGIPRQFSRKTRYDYYWPAFSHLGEQAVLNKEIYAQDPSVLDPATNAPMNESVFGYQERWAEYRYAASKITGKFRSNDPQSLDFWHLAQDFSALPTLSAAFIEENPPIARVVAVQTEPQFLFDSHIEMKCTRPMPTYSIPGYIDHF